MRKYMFKRILFSVFSLLVVIMIVMLLVYTAINRNVIFQTDDTWNKKSNNDRAYYEFNQYRKYGYLTFVDYTNFLQKKYKPIYGEEYSTSKEFIDDKKAISEAKDYDELIANGNASVQEFIKQYKDKGYEIKFYPKIAFKSGKLKPGGTAYLLAIEEKSVFLRLWDYIKGFFTVETTSMVKDPELKASDRGLKLEKDPYSGLFAITGSGTQHKYLLYFENRFPFIRQNFIHINLGTSYTTYRGQEITTVINTPTGLPVKSKQQFPLAIQNNTGEYVNTAIDFHSLTYNSAVVSDIEKTQYPDKYTVYSFKRSGLSMMENSFVMGIIATILAYLIGLPLGILNARHKDKLVDKFGNAYIIFIMAVPSLAYIFLFAAIGTRVFGLPYKFATAKKPILGYILPIISLSLPSIGGLMKWMRRYMIDQMNADYVKFARAEGMSEKEIYRTHISRNAMIYLVHGIPGSILGCFVGAIITERVYSVPGVGNLLTVAINTHDNGIIVAVAAFYTLLSIVSIILGDLLLARYDPRISLNSDKGGGR